MYRQRIQTASVPDTMLTTGITALFSLTCALAVANVYSAQPLLDSMAVSLKVSPGMIGQRHHRYAGGLCHWPAVPGSARDWLNRKYVVMSQLLLSVAALVAAGLSPNIATLLGAMLIVGLMAVVVQVLVAWVAILATPQKRGQAVGTLTSGIVSGILLSRFISGAIADIAGWRAVYLTAACLMLMIAGIVWKIMPSPPQQPQKPTYLSLLKSVFQLYLTEPQLRKRGILALFIFAAFSMLWTTMVMPLTALSLSHTQTGMFGLAGFAGMLAAARAGKWADQGWAQRTTGLALALLTISWLPIGYAETSLLWLIAGVIALDFAVQAVHVSSQSLIIAARPAAASRLVGAYMCFYSLGSAAGAIVATQLYSHWGWQAVCLAGAAVSACAFLIWSGSRQS
ncbi:major facilitator transporter [Klebsiella pneumoniae]|uniref:Major facilitator transporter n=1 Tax=Klebsiella pneumoniae TaxID=573 RepID=A0A378B314_KLEPN|nr:major facilitator transporter [Klebsiella pneumoniae]